MGFIDDDAAPGDLPQLGAVGQDHLEGGDEGVELIRPGDQVVLQRRGQPSARVHGSRVKLVGRPSTFSSLQYISYCWIICRLAKLPW